MQINLHFKIFNKNFSLGWHTENPVFGNHYSKEYRVLQSIGVTLNFMHLRYKDDRTKF